MQTYRITEKGKDLLSEMMDCGIKSGELEEYTLLHYLSDNKDYSHTKLTFILPNTICLKWALENGYVLEKGGLPQR